MAAPTDAKETPTWMRLAPSANARSVAIIRIATGLIAIRMGLQFLASDLATLPEALRVAPVGTEWALDLVPVTSLVFQLATGAFMAAAAAVTIGYRARAFAALATLLGLYVGWVPHLTGKVDHYHHIVWFLALMALAPCDDALAVRRSGRAYSADRYAAVSLAGAVMLGIVYLTAGLPKLEAGIDWALSDNLRNIMWTQWYEKQHSSPLPIDQWPLVYRAMGVGTVVFELLFLPAVLFRRTRIVTAFVGIAFHLATWLFLGISFWSLLALYVVLFDWGATAAIEPVRRDPPAAVAAPVIVAVLVVAGALTMGPRAWPVAGYPTFSAITEPAYLEFMLVTDQEMLPITRSALADAFGSHRVRDLANNAIANGDEGVLLEYAATLAGEAPGHYASIVRALISTHPDTVGQILQVAES